MIHIIRITYAKHKKRENETIRDNLYRLKHNDSAQWNKGTVKLL